MADKCAMDAARPESVLSFPEVADRFESVYRVAYLADGGRNEGDADHAWYVCLFAMLLHTESELEPELPRVPELCPVHDLVEIHAGDTDAYDERGYPDKRGREGRVAERLSALLPEGIGARLRSLWDRFEESRTPEACFDQNVFGGGKARRGRGVTEEMTRERRVETALDQDPSMPPSSRRSPAAGAGSGRGVRMGGPIGRRKFARY